MKIMITANDLMDLGLWTKYCEVEGINHYAVNEGLIDSDELLEVDTEKMGIELLIKYTK